MVHGAQPKMQPWDKKNIPKEKNSQESTKMVKLVLCGPVVWASNRGTP